MHWKSSSPPVEVLNSSLPRPVWRQAEEGPLANCHAIRPLASTCIYIHFHVKNTWWTLFDTRQHCIICQCDIIYRIYFDDVYMSNDSNMFLICFEAFVLKLRFWGCSSWCSTWIVWWNFKTLGRDGCAAFIGGGTWGQFKDLFRSLHAAIGF